MKNIVYFIAIFIIAASCNKSEQQTYSCNKDLNDWVTTHKDGVADITRDQFVTLPTTYQKAVFKSFTKEKKTSLWHEKLDILLESDYYNEDFKRKIEELKTFVEPDIYDFDIGEKPDDYILDYLDVWEQDVLGIYEPDTVIFSINFTTLMTLEEFDYYIDNYDTFDYSWLEGGDEIEAPDRLPGGDGTCTCIYDIFCSIFMDVDCTEGLNGCSASWDCGVAGGSECTGQCDDASSVTPPGQ